MKNYFLLFGATLMCGAAGLVACGDTITNVNSGGFNGDEEDAGSNVIDGDASGRDVDLGFLKPGKDSSAPGQDSSTPDTNNNTSCTSGHVKCDAGYAHECVASAWAPSALSCVAACSKPEGVWSVDRSQIAPAPSVILRRGSDKVLFTRPSPLLPFSSARDWCAQYGAAWILPTDATFVSNMLPSPPVAGCNPSLDQAAFPGLSAGEELWIYDGFESPVNPKRYAFSLATNSTVLVPDQGQRRVICLLPIP